MNRELDLEIIHAYITGRMTVTEVTAFERKMSEDDALQAEVEAVRQAWDAAESYQLPTWNAESALTSMPFAEDTVVVMKPRAAKSWMSWAAVLLVVLGVGFLINNFLPARVSTHSTPGLLTLSDGTEVFLNDRSSISFPQEFDNKRVVTLDGEAFFDVERNMEHQFEIRTDIASVSVLGTSFSVNEDDDSGVIDVVVKTGRVRVSPNGSDQYLDLEEGEAVTFDVATRTLKKRQLEDLNDIAWYTRSLKWRDAGLAEIAEDLESVFDIKVDFSDVNTALSCGVTSNYYDIQMDDLDEILLTLEDVLGIKSMEMGDGTYHLSGGACD